MQAIALTALRRLELTDVPPPTLRQPTDVLIRIHSVGVCGSDLHYFVDGRIGAKVVQFPFILGHECSGVIVEAGADVTRVRPGQLVAVDPAVSCHRCDQCLSGREHTCRALRFLGCPGELEGCLSEYLVMPEASVYPVTDGMTPDEAALCEPLSIGVYAVQLGSVRRGERVGILGCGPIGCCVLLATQAAGASGVYVTDRIDSRVAFAARKGATWSGNTDKTDTTAAVMSREPGGLDVVFECAGQQAALDQALQWLRPGGRLVIVGIPREDRVSFNIDTLRRREISIINVRRQNRCVQPAIQLMAHRRIDTTGLITHRFRPTEAQRAFEMVDGYEDGVMKAVVSFA